MLHAPRARVRRHSSRTWLALTLFSVTSCAGAGPSNPNGGGTARTQSCIDLDGDGYGAGCKKGWDCDDHDAKKTSDCGPATGIIDWVPGIDAGAPDVYVPPSVETPTCPANTKRIHVKDVWSAGATPTLNLSPTPPLTIAIVDTGGTWTQYGARKDALGCSWYSACIPTTVANVKLVPQLESAGCPPDANGPGSIGPMSLSGAGAATEFWVVWDGTPSTTYGSPGPYTLATTAPADACPAGQPDLTTPANFTRVHVRWPWGDPAKTGFPGSGTDSSKGYPTPPYPNTLLVKGSGTCSNNQALIEFQDGHCPWYSILIPNDKWTGSITIYYPNDTAGTSGLATQAIPLPQPRDADEYWLAYASAPDQPGRPWSTSPNAMRWYSKNPGPGWAGCGGAGDVLVDPCNPAPPTDFSVVHFRYIWAGQKIFTFFPNPALMPSWIVMEVGGEDIVCLREADRPWFNCPVPNSHFKEGTLWRAVDKTHSPEWNTVQNRGDFPTKPGEYWLRWYYGKPDMTSGTFKFFDYYPDATNGDWSATATWNDESCAQKPPATPIVIGYPNAWFPYDETGFSYPFGASLARTYAKSAEVQDLFNALVWERYQIWKTNYLKYDSDACGAGTARVRSDPPETVSEGQGYGIAMAAAIGDKDTFTKLWNFTRHFLSQKSQKYCGGLMGWMWQGPGDCKPLDHTCDADKGENCGGNNDSAFDGDVDIGIGLVYAARQWPEFMDAAIGWLLKMECEVDDVAEPSWKFPAPGDTWNRTNCSGYPGSRCQFVPGADAKVNMSYYPPGYFRVFGDFLATYSAADAAERTKHRDFWYKTAESVYELTERCYDNTAVNPGLYTDWGTYKSPCSSNTDNYNWSRGLWRIAVDASWFGDRTTLPENTANSSTHYPTKTRMQAKIDNIQEYYSNFYVKNPTAENANRFSTLCKDVTPAGTATGCDPAFDHNSYFVGCAMCSYANGWDNGGATTAAIRREAIEEAISSTIMNDKYYQESIGVYTLMFLTGNFPNPMVPPGP